MIAIRVMDRVLIFHFRHSGNLNDLNFTFDVTSLPTGFHNLFLRFKNVNGAWSSVHTRTLYKENLGTVGSTIPNITSGEYFIDADPSYGKGTNINITQDIDLNNLAFITDVTSLSTGFHNIATRFKNANGRWSQTNIRSFYKEAISSAAPKPDIVKVEYYIDTDPGFGKGINVGFTPTKDVTNLNFPVDMSVVSIGNHKLYLRALDALGKWSLISIGIFSVEPPSALYITVGNLAQKVCAGGAFKIPFSVNTLYGSNNIFTAQLSDGNGSFTNPVNIGSIAGNHNDTLSAAFADLSFTVLKAVATMVFSNINQVYSGASKTVTIVTSPGSLPLVVTYNLSAAAPVNAGAYKVVATINSPNYTGVDSTTLTIAKASQEITLESIPDKQFTTAPFSISATTTSGLPVTVSLTSNPAGIDSINGNSITMTGLGTVYISATQAGNPNYNAAAEKLDTFKIIKATQIINLPVINDQFINDTLVINVNASSGLPVVYSIATTPVSGVAILKNDSIITLSDTGRVTLTLSQAGNAFYSPVEIQRTFKVVRYNQTITFNTIATKTFGDAPFVVVGTSTSGLPVTFRKISGPVTVKNDTVTLTGAGTAVIEANQVGNDLYRPANAVRQTFTVLPDLRAPDLFVQNVTSAITEVSTGDSAIVSWKVANIGTLSSALNWTERIYMQTPNGANRTLLKQGTYNTAGSLDTGKFVSRSEKVFFPIQVTIGDSGVFVVEVIADPLANEAPVNLANNIGLQSPGWSVKKLLLLTFSESSLTEGSTLSTTINRTAAVISPLTVNINLKNTNRYTVPATVVIPAGQSGFRFAITAIDNQLIEGTILDTLTVSANSFAAAKQGFSLLDNDKPSLTITELIAEINEGDSVTFKVNTNAISNTATQVFLSSSNQARFPVPASVTIPAGSAFVAVKVRVLQNTIPEIRTAITIQAGAVNHNATTASIFVNDDDLPGLELVFETNTIAESAGFFATKATLRRKANSNPAAFTATLSANVSNALILPAGVNLAANENEKTFNVGVVDNTLVDGERTVSVTTSIYVNSCGCSAPPNAAGSVTSSINITDNDGPALTLTASTLTVIEGQTEAGLLRITRNTSTTQPLIVNFSSSNTGEATLPLTATIPAGQAFVEVPITTINDNVTDGSKQVYFEATAASFATGSVWVVVTDLNKPDFQITGVVVPVNALQSMTVFDYKVSVKNSGFSTAAAGILVRGYLSVDNVLDDGDSLLTEDITNEVIKQGETIQIVNAANVPNLPGVYKLIFKVNPLSTVTELLLTNNTSQPVSCKRCIWH